MKKLILFTMILFALGCEKSATEPGKEMYCVTCQKRIGTNEWGDTTWKESYCADKRSAEAYLEYKNSGTLYKCFMQAK